MPVAIVPTLTLIDSRASAVQRQRRGAHRILRFLLGPERTYPNMFDAHPPFQIDGKFAGAAAIVEMLLQSRGNEISLLPALPRAWPDGSIRGLRARGACTVDLEWRAHRLVHTTLTSAAGGVYQVCLGARRQAVTLRAGKPLRLAGARLGGGRGQLIRDRSNMWSSRG